MARAGFSSSSGMRLDFDFSGLDEYISMLRRIPDDIHHRVIRSAMTSAAEPILKAGRSLAPRGYQDQEFRIRGERFRRPSRLAATFAKKIKVYSKDNVGLAIVGSRSSTAPHAHLVRGGTGKFINSPLPKRSRRVRRGTRDYVVPPGKVLRIPVDSFHRYSRKGRKFERNPIGGYVFIRGGIRKRTIIKNEGSRPNPWWDFAIERARRESIQAMASTFVEALQRVTR